MNPKYQEAKRVIEKRLHNFERAEKYLATKGEKLNKEQEENKQLYVLAKQAIEELEGQKKQRMMWQEEANKLSMELQTCKQEKEKLKKEISKINHLADMAVYTKGVQITRLKKDLAHYKSLVENLPSEEKLIEIIKSVPHKQIYSKRHPEYLERVEQPIEDLAKAIHDRLQGGGK